MRGWPDDLVARPIRGGTELFAPEVPVIHEIVAEILRQSCD